MNERIYLLHEYGAKSHYRALEYLCHTRNVSLIYREFSMLNLLAKSIIRFDVRLFFKQFQNLFFLFSLMVTRNKKIVLGVAPYDVRLRLFAPFLKKHRLYFHTSWISWDRSFYPKKRFVNERLMEFWENFIRDQIIKIFAVSQVTKDQLIGQLDLNDDKIVVVNHSFDESIYFYRERQIQKNFLCVGRLRDEKGIEELLEYFSGKPEWNLTFVGDGVLADKVREVSDKYPNIKYRGFISDQKVLAKIYNEHDFILLNSKKIGHWEELFGIVLIEAMACGVIPIASDHKGPKEILLDGINGFLSPETEFIERVDFLMNSDVDFYKIRENVIQKSRQYTVKMIAQRWEAIFE